MGSDGNGVLTKAERKHACTGEHVVDAIRATKHMKVGVFDYMIEQVVLSDWVKLEVER